MYRNKPSWNVLFPDGHVQSVESQLLFSEMKKREAANSDSKQITDNWNDGANTHFDDYRDILESQAKGQDPRSRPLTARCVPHAIVSTQ
jgi:hypothetical protein